MLLPTLLFAACTAAASVDYTRLKDAQGNGIPDFSFAGYHGAQKPLPSMTSSPTKTLKPGNGDQTSIIQEALNSISQGGGGVLLLAAGSYKIRPGLTIPNSTVLRGSGPDQTFLLADSGAQTLIRLGISVTGSAIQQTVKITDAYYPVGSRMFNVTDTTGLRIGQDIYIQRPVSQAWIDANGMNKKNLSMKANKTENWLSPGTLVQQPRRIAAIDAKTKAVTIDIPITDQLDPKYMNSSIAVYKFPQASSEVGLENLAITLNPSCSGKSPEGSSSPCAAFAVNVTNYTQDSWIRYVEIRGSNNGVTTEFRSRRLTIDTVRITRDEKTLDVKGALAFDFAINGCQTFIANCAVLFPAGSNTKSYPVVTGILAPGPNVVTNFTNVQPSSRIEPHQRWAHGFLVEKSISDTEFVNRGTEGSGYGWTMNAGVAWNNQSPKGGRIKIDSPPLGSNWDIGSTGTDDSTTKSKFSVGSSVQPDSLFAAQKAARGL